MRSNYNARAGLKLCTYAELGFALGSLTLLGGLIGTLFAFFTAGAYICRLQGMKKAVQDNVEYQRASRLMMIGLAVTGSLILISFYKKSYVYSGMMMEMNAVLTVLSTFMIFRATIAMLEYNGRTELVARGKKAFTIYWVTYALYFVCALSGLLEYWIGATAVTVLHVVAVLLAFFASWTFYNWLRRTAPVV